MTLERPIIIVGVGRSGSSVFHRLLSGHPGVVWLSQLADRYPDRPWVNRLAMQGLGVPGLCELLRWRLDPGECYPFWDRYYPGFSVPCRDLVAGDLTLRARDSVRRTLGAMLTSSRSRVLLKVTGWPRLGFLQELFPEARFVHVLRDGRPVASSFMQVDWWWGWRGPGNWRWGPLTAEYQAEWERHGRSFVALAGIQWKLLMDALEAARPLVPAEAFHEIRYEELCAAPVETCQRAVEFCGLTWTRGFESMVRSTPLRSENEKWRRDFTPAQQAVLDDVLRDHLLRYGYR